VDVGGVGCGPQLRRGRRVTLAGAALHVAVSVDAIVVALIPEWGTRNFLVLREDGSTDNWSIKKCITNLRPDGRSTERNNHE